MGMFSKILNKLGIKKDKKEAPAAAKGAVGAKPAAAKSTGPAKRTEAPKQPAPAKKSTLQEKREMVGGKAASSGAVPMVDVTSKLATMAKGTNLDWKVSIVDLLKVLDLDSSLDARKELANELGCPPDLIGGDYAEMNVWLHKKVLAEIAENGGNIPQELLD
jgi:hypothetical protein